MAEVSTEELRMRQFLLGQLGEKEREELEQLVLTEPGVRDKMLMAEDDLIEEYLEGSLQSEEQTEFLCQFLSIPHQRNKLRIAKSLRRFARGEVNIDTAPVEPIPLPLPQPFYRSSLLYVPVVALIVVAIGIGIFWYEKHRRAVARDTQRQAVESELAQLNASDEQSLPADQISTIIILPISPRSVVAGASATLSSPILEVWLVPATKSVDRYNAVLQKIHSDDKYHIPNLRLHERSDGKAIRLRIPTRLLTPGVYRVHLDALSLGGSTVDAGEYNFEIQ
jgi:hypothetical protein